MGMRGGSCIAGLTEGLKVASERLSWGFSRGAKALAGGRQPSNSLTAKARRALRAAPQVHYMVCLDSFSPPHFTQDAWFGDLSQVLTDVQGALETLYNCAPEMPVAPVYLWRKGWLTLMLLA